MNWEYRTIRIAVKQGWNESKGAIETSDTDDLLNRYGEQGWELVTALDTEHSTGTAAIFCIFKRPVEA